jgi:hypothetical protein
MFGGSLSRRPHDVANDAYTFLLNVEPGACPLALSHIGVQQRQAMLRRPPVLDAKEPAAVGHLGAGGVRLQWP